MEMYEVSKHGHIVYHIRAKSGGAAKREACKRDGISPGDSWCGMSNYSARKMSAVEAADWEAGEADRRAVNRFIAGMMELTTKAHREKKEALMKGGNDKC